MLTYLNHFLDFIFIERAIKRLNEKIERIDTIRNDSIDQSEQEILKVLHSILFRCRIPTIYNGNHFHKANGIQTCINLITTFNGDSEIVSLVLKLIIIHLTLDTKTETFKTANAIDIICPDLNQSPLGKLTSLYHDDSDTWHLTKEMLELLSKSKQNRTFLLLDDIATAISLDVPFESYKKMVSCAWDDSRLNTSSLDDLKILVSEAAYYPKNLEIMEKAMAIIIDVIHKRKKIWSGSTSKDENKKTIEDLRSLLINAIKCGNETVQLAAFRIIAMSPSDLFATDVDVASTILFFLNLPKTNLHFIALLILSISCEDKLCVRALELIGLKAYLYNLIHVESEMHSGLKVPYQLRLLYKKDELIQGNISALSCSSSEITQTSNHLSLLERKHKPEYGTVRDLFEHGEHGIF